MAVAALCLAFALPGCTETPDAINPVSWWHSMEGGEIAQDRPPPPRDTDPFPRLGDAPQRPAGMPDWEWQAMSKTLADQRDQAKGYAAANPIPVLPNPPPVAPKPAVATPPTAAPVAAVAPADDATSAMTFNGPTTPAKTSGPKTVAIPGVSAGADTKTKFFAPNNQLSVPGAMSPPVVQADEAALPPVPTTMPLPPTVAGFDVPQSPAPFVPPVPVPQPAPYVPPPALPAVPPFRVSFAPGSAVLSVRMQNALKVFASSHGSARIAVTGFGDATGAAIPDQAAVMALALERARAIAVQLNAFGVQTTEVATDARAEGQGGLARLID